VVGDNLKHCYKVLGLTPAASFVEVKRAYRALVKAWHPDRFVQKPHLQQQALETFHVINRAYATIRQASLQHNLHRADMPARADAAAPPYRGRGTTSSTSQPTVPTPHSVRHAVAKAARLPTWVIALAAFVALRLLVAHSLVAIDLGPLPLPFTSPTVERSNALAVPPPIDSQVQSLASPLASSLTSQDADQAIPVASQTTTSQAVQSGMALQYFTVGSTKAEVFAVQGPPTLAGMHLWEYGGSRVYFRHDRVIRWEVWPRSPLKVKLLPAAPLDTMSLYFTVGSTKDEVLTIQGTPSYFTERMWEYGQSRVYFDGDRVTRWDEWRGSPLKARPAPADAG
jgi:hypothetical protein